MMRKNEFASRDEPIICCFCGKEIFHYLDSHSPEPLATYPDRCCNACNEIVVQERLKEIRDVHL